MAKTLRKETTQAEGCLAGITPASLALPPASNIGAVRTGTADRARHAIRRNRSPSNIASGTTLAKIAAASKFTVPAKLRRPDATPSEAAMSRRRADGGGWKKSEGHYSVAKNLGHFDELVGHDHHYKWETIESRRSRPGVNTSPGM